MVHDDKDSRTAPLRENFTTWKEELTKRRIQQKQFLHTKHNVDLDRDLMYTNIHKQGQNVF